MTGCFKEDLTSDLVGVEEMFIPVDDEEERGITVQERKVPRERDVRVAKGKVEKQVSHWVGFFRGHKRYFEVGRVVGLDETENGKRELCEAAKRARPKRGKDTA